MNSSKSKHSFCLLLLLCVNGIVSANELSSDYYASTCPAALLTIKAAVLAAVLKEPRMGASLLRLHFHDCFVQGCDASILLDDSENFRGEKTAFPNVNSVRSYEVIDKIKSALEFMCPGVVSCADIVAVAARDSVVTLGGPSWEVKMGRKDSITASLDDANRDLPAPFLDLSGLISAFSKKGFTAQEMVALSGSHTIGQAKCATFRTRAHNDTNIDPSFAASLRARCPSAGGDGNLSPLDATTPNFFDNSYFRNLVNNKGLLHSDQALFNGGSSDSLVTTYVSDPWRFRADFANAMLKMSELSPLTGSHGQIRRNCRKLN
ncbi:cationic peroxidase 1-like [Prosopis cineraria]|uniref:cationic peroxidase 1-like n=1 Tax=Prosopis cineraria TaxID=364024 RepID=UPI0024109B8F|nr:cationic peroxidase 1-like [Prosopis cineraria]